MSFNSFEVSKNAAVFVPRLVDYLKDVLEPYNFICKQEGYMKYFDFYDMDTIPKKKKRLVKDFRNNSTEIFPDAYIIYDILFVCPPNPIYINFRFTVSGEKRSDSGRLIAELQHPTLPSQSNTNFFSFHRFVEFRNMYDHVQFGRTWESLTDFENEVHPWWVLEGLKLIEIINQREKENV